MKKGLLAVHGVQSEAVLSVSVLVTIRHENPS